MIPTAGYGLDETPLVSVVIPCRNEAAHIGGCLDSVADGDYPTERIEILVVDGQSDDGTREIVAEQRTRRPFIRMLDNPRRTIPAALNLGIRTATGDVILRLDAHCRYGPDHVRECVRHLRETGADDVGGRIVTMARDRTAMGRAIALAMSERFGMGGSRFRTTRDRGPQEPAWVDVVPFPCFRRDVFERVGFFDERVERSEDIEFHGRMRALGCRTLFVPSIVSHYYARSDYGAFAGHAFSNGRWAILPTRHTGRLVVSVRHLVPLFAATAVIVLGGMSFVSDAARATLYVLLGSYTLTSVGVSLSIAWRERAMALAVLLPVVFATLHAAYGLGSLVAAVQIGPGLLGLSRLQPSRTP